MASFKDFLKNQHDMEMEMRKIRSAYAYLLTKMRLKPYDSDAFTIVWYVANDREDSNGRQKALEQAVSTLTIHLGKPIVDTPVNSVIAGAYIWKGPKFELRLNWVQRDNNNEFFNLIDKVNI